MFYIIKMQANPAKTTAIESGINHAELGGASTGGESAGGELTWGASSWGAEYRQTQLHKGQKP